MYKLRGTAIKGSDLTRAEASSAEGQLSNGALKEIGGQSL